MLKEIQIKTPLNKVKNLPYSWDLNIYRWCEHKCKYCFAMYSHQYLDNENFFDDIFVKTNILEELEKKLASPRWKWEVINLWWVTDSYQYEAESKYWIMREIWKVLIKYKQPVTISTKSKLILRDIDLINELSQITMVNAWISLITLDDKLREKLEPWACSVKERLEILKALKKTNANVGWLMMPIIPLITDREIDLEKIFHQAHKIGVDYIIPWPLNLIGKTRETFLEFVKKEFPEKYNEFLKLYQGRRFVDKKYTNKLNIVTHKFMLKYNLSGYSKIMQDRVKEYAKNKREVKQESLF